MKIHTRVLPLLALAGLSACTILPTGPGVLALPGTQKSLEQFQGDDVACRQFALGQVTNAADVRKVAPEESQRRYDYAYIQCMYSKGQRVPVPAGYTSSPVGSPPPVIQPPPPPAS